MKSNIYKTIIFSIVIIFSVLSIGAKDIIWFPMFKGNCDGTRITVVIPVADLTADKWVLGDTTTAGAYYPEQALELVDVKVLGDFDSGDSMKVTVYETNSTNDTIAVSDTLVGTAFCSVTDATITAANKIIDTDEGMAVLYDFIAGTPNNVSIILEFITRQKDYLE